MSTFGTLFRVTTFGESHCKGVGAIIDGVPPNLLLSETDIQGQLNRRRPGQSKLSTPRDEKDKVYIQSGTEHGRTLGTPVSLFVANEDQRPGDYSTMEQFPRPSHADFTYMAKYGLKASSGGGRASARETISRVAAGAVAEKWLKEEFGIEIVAWVSSVGEESENAGDVDINSIGRDVVDSNVPVRCARAADVARFQKQIEAARDAHDSTGGVVCVVCRNVPAGWGEPCFDKLEALMAHAMLSIPATKGFEVGSGFKGAAMRGSVHNDPFVQKGARLGTRTNNSGGIQGGISNGEPILMRIAFKPPATIGKEQQTSKFDGSMDVLENKGRHDPCVVPRAVPIVEAMAALVLADCALLQLAKQHATSKESLEENQRLQAIQLKCSQLEYLLKAAEQDKATLKSYVGSRCPFHRAMRMALPVAVGLFIGLLARRRLSA